MWKGEQMNSEYLPPAPIEVVTPNFRGVAQNFFTMPMHLLVDLKAAREEKKGDELLLMLDACEIAFTNHDMEKLQDLSINDFLLVVQAWVEQSHR